MSTWILAEPIFIITSWYTEIKLLDSTYTGMNVNFFFPQNGEKITKKVQTFFMRADTSCTLCLYGTMMTR